MLMVLKTWDDPRVKHLTVYSRLDAIQVALGLFEKGDLSSMESRAKKVREYVDEHIKPWLTDELSLRRQHEHAFPHKLHQVRKMAGDAITMRMELRKYLTRLQRETLASFAGQSAYSIQIDVHNFARTNNDALQALVQQYCQACLVFHEGIAPTKIKWCEYQLTAEVSRYVECAVMCDERPYTFKELVAKIAPGTLSAADLRWLEQHISDRIYKLRSSMGISKLGATSGAKP